MRLNQLIRLYFYICQVYEEELKWHCERFTKNRVEPKFTDQELITTFLFSLAYCQMRTLKACYEHLDNYYRDWFPTLPSYQAYVNRLNRLASVFPVLVSRLYTDSRSEQQTEQLLGMMLTDSMPIMTCSGIRRGKVARHLTDYGYCATKKLKYYGVKLHCLGGVHPGTLPVMEYALVSQASTNDLEAQRQVLEGLSNRIVLGDSAFGPKDLQDKFTSNGGLLICPQKNSRWESEAYKKWVRAPRKLRARMIARVRQAIESFFNALNEATGIQQASKVRSAKGLITHIFGRLAAFAVKRLFKAKPEFCS